METPLAMKTTLWTCWIGSILIIYRFNLHRDQYECLDYVSSCWSSGMFTSKEHTQVWFSDLLRSSGVNAMMNNMFDDHVSLDYEFNVIKTTFEGKLIELRKKLWERFLAILTIEIYGNPATRHWKVKIGKLQKYSRKVSGSALRRMAKLSSFCLSSRKIFWIMNFSFSVQWLEPSYATRNQRSLKQIRTWWCMETSKLEIYVPIRLFFRCDTWNDEIVTGNRKSIGFGGIVLGFKIFRDNKVWKGF